MIYKNTGKTTPLQVSENDYASNGGSMVVWSLAMFPYNKTGLVFKCQVGSDLYLCAFWVPLLPLRPRNIQIMLIVHSKLS